MLQLSELGPRGANAALLPCNLLLSNGLGLFSLPQLPLQLLLRYHERRQLLCMLFFLLLPPASQVWC